MGEKPKNFWQKHRNSLLVVLAVFGAFALLVLVAIVGFEPDDKALIERTLEARERAVTGQDIDFYMTLVSQDYQYKPQTSQTIREYMEKHLSFWDTVHLQTYNRNIYIDGDLASITQDYQMSVEKKGKTRVFDGTERFLLKKVGVLKKSWLFVGGLD